MSKIQAITQPDARAEALVAHYERAGYGRVAPAILQPAEPFLDLSGEDIRKSLYLTTDLSGEELCLRPDLTIPVARDYLASGRAGQPAGFSYLGPVFRYRNGQANEFMQAGIESFGRQDRPAADAEMLALALEATAAFGVRDVEIRTGDVALFNAMLHVLRRDGMLDWEFIGRSTENLAGLEALIDRWSPERAAAVCDLPSQLIVRAAHMFGTARAALSLYCQGLNQSSHGTWKNCALKIAEIAG